jgi:hypothetical protein
MDNEEWIIEKLLIIPDCVALGICVDKTRDMFALEVMVSWFHCSASMRP